MCGQEGQAVSESVIECGIFDCGLRNKRLRIADCGLWIAEQTIADCGLWILE